MLCTLLAELTQRIDDELAQSGSGAAIDYGAVERRIADALGAFERGLHAQILRRLDIEMPAIRVWGDEYRRIGRLESDYHTLADRARDANGVLEDGAQRRHARPGECARRRRRRHLRAGEAAGFGGLRADAKKRRVVVTSAWAGPSTR